MPKREKTFAGGIKPISWGRLNRKPHTGIVSSYGPGELYVIDVLVETADWGDDDGTGAVVTPTYGVPNPGFTVKYVDIEHPFGSQDSVAVSFRDQYNGRVSLTFFDQRPLDNQIIRIWLEYSPTHNIKVKVVR